MFSTMECTLRRYCTSLQARYENRDRDGDGDGESGNETGMEQKRWGKQRGGGA